MSALDLFDRGYEALVSVIPPDAQLAPTTGVRAQHRGKVPGIRRRDGLWVGYSYLTTDPPTRRDVERWQDDWHCNVGLAGARFPALDIDVDNPQLAEAICNVALQFFGSAPIRLSREPRRLLVFRTEDPFTRISATIQYQGEDHLVEWLCGGRQYVVHGRHPTGVEYRWLGRPLWDIDPADLPLVTAEQAQAFFQHLQDKLGTRAKVEIRGDGKVREIVPPQETLLAPSPLALRGIVAEIPNRFPDRDDYIQVGYAIKAAVGGSDEGLDIWQEWCARWEGGENDPEEVESDWRRMHPPFTVGWSWLCQLAEEHGASPAQHEFEADPDAVPPPPREVQVVTIHYTDTWVTEQILPLVATEARYVPESGRWHVWDGAAWVPDCTNYGQHIVRKALTHLSSRIVDMAKCAPDEKQTEKMTKFAATLQSRGALTRVLPELEAHPKLTLRMDDFDADPWVLNTPGGIVDLRTGTTAPCSPEALQSKATAVAPKAEPPRNWLAFMEEVTGGDTELQTFIQKFLGYSLTGVTQEQCLAFIHGPPLTGKSVFIETVSGILGSYHATAAADTFAAARGDRHPADLAKLAGSRLVTAVETHEGRAWDTQRVKSLTGGDTVSARFMRQDFFEFRPTFKIVIVGNHLPTVKGVDAALMRRLHMVPFEHHPAEVDRLLGDKLRAEWPQILHWMIEGCLMWLETGLDQPEAVRIKTEQYKEDEDPVGQFIEDKCVVEPLAEVSREDLYRAWARWCHAQGEDPGSLKTLRRRFEPHAKEHGFSDARLGSGYDRPRGYRGIRIIEDDIQGVLT